MNNRRELDIVPESIAMALTNLFTAFNQRMDRPSALMYWRAPHHVPAALLAAAVSRAVRERVFLPRPAEVRRDAEACRVELRDRYAWQSCGECSQQGLRLSKSEDGTYSAERCPCVERHAAILRQMGAHGP